MCTSDYTEANLRFEFEERPRTSRLLALLSRRDLQIAIPLKISHGARNFLKTIPQQILLKNQRPENLPSNIYVVQAHPSIAQSQDSQ
jgi:hypothetical protein